jgi:hypothetical protein
MTLVVALSIAILIEASIAGYFVYTIVPYVKADAEWSRKYGKQTKEE